jgi:RNA polymerase sigma factor (sigma-70 family)
MTTADFSTYPLDSVLVKGLKSREPDIQRTAVERFFYNDLRGLINSIRWDLFKGTVEYDDIVSELYLFLSASQWKALNSYRGESRLTTWVSRVAWRHFIRMHVRKEREITVDDIWTPACGCADTVTDDDIRMDVETVLSNMSNPRYVQALRLNIVEGYDAENAAALMETSVDNFYNIKSRALRQFISMYGEQNAR